MSAYKTNDRVTTATYGAGTVLRPHGEHQVVVQFDTHNGFRDTKPLIVWGYSLNRV